MRHLLFLFLTLSISNPIISQSTESKIKTTILNYMEGTSYNQLDRIEKAFYPEADLFLDGKDNTIRIVPIMEYISYFKDNEYGAFNGRIGKILSIDYFGNIAQAKVEILMPKYNRRYVDMFILKIIDGEWKIISKTANSEKSEKKGERILMVVSNAHYYGTSDIGTGNSFSEIVFAYDVFNHANYTVDFVSPEGGTVPLAYINTSNELQEQYLYDTDFMYGLKHTIKADDLVYSDYKAVYFTGGGSAMFGVPENKTIQKIAMNIYEENQGVISSVCHGTAGIVNLKTKEGKYLYDGKKVSGSPDDHEHKDSEYYKQFPFHIQETIVKRNGKFKYSEIGQAHMEVDGRLVTGQNNQSSKMIAEKVVEILTVNKNKK